MSTGGGISLFASRKPPSSNGDKSVGQPTENQKAVTLTTTKFSFGKDNESSDANSASSDSQFGFFGGGTSFGGDDFGMMSNGGYSLGDESQSEGNNDSNTSTENKETNGGNGGISLFRGRTIATTPSGQNLSFANQQGNEDLNINPANTADGGGGGGGILLFRGRNAASMPSALDSTFVNHQGKGDDEMGQEPVIATDGGNGGISLFRGRNNAATPSRQDLSFANQQGKKDEELGQAIAASKFMTSSSHIRSEEAFDLSQHNQTFNNRMIMAPKSTPDGRVLPMPVYPTAVTPHASNTSYNETRESGEKGFAPMTTVRTKESPSQDNSQCTMGPPPNRNTAAVTPTETAPASRFNSQVSGTAATKLFPTEGHSFLNEKTYVASTGVTRHNGSTSQLVDDTTDNDDSYNNDFHQRQQQFTTMIRDLHDMDTKFQDEMFDGKLQVDVAIALLLQMKCNTYQVTDQILEHMDFANVALRDFLPEDKEQE